MVQLVPMTEAEFQIYLQRAIKEYADEKVKAGNWQASEAMRALEGKVKELGLNKISLHVFAHNSAAIRLYEKVGYEVTNLFMAKEC